MPSRRTFLIGTSLVALASRPAAARLPDDESRIAFSRPPATLDPRETLDHYGRTIVDQVYQTVLRRIDGAIVPNAAESCQLEPGNRSNLRWIVRVRQGMRLHSGDHLDAAAVKYSIELAARRWSGLVSRVELVDPTIVVVTTATPDGPLPSRLCEVFVAPVGYYDGAKDDVGKKLFFQPNGSGEFRLVTHVADSHLVMERFDNFWGKKPVLKRVVYQIVREKAKQRAMVLAGELDVTDDPPRTDWRDDLKRDGILAQGLGPIVFVKLNARAMPDPQLRTALGLALDRKAIAEQHGGAPIDVIFAPEAPASPRDPVRWPARHVVQAQAILKQAKVPTPLTILAAGDLVTTAEAVASQWKAVGLPVKLETIEPAALRSRMSQGAAPEAYVHRTANIWDPDFPLSTFVASNSDFSAFANQQADALIASGRHEVVTERRAEIYRRLLEVLVADPPYIPLYRENRYYGVASRIVWLPPANGLVLGRDLQLKK